MKVCGYLIRYDELGLKGKNRFFFEKKLISNIKEKLKEVSTPKFEYTIDHLWGRLLVRCEESSEVRSRLLKIFGISSLSPIVEVPSDLSTIQEKALALVPHRSSTFRVTTRRVDKKFPLTSRAVNIEVANFLLPERPLLKIDLDDPELELGIEIRQEKTFLFLEKESGLGGLPVGTSGKVLTLLSGGIDSPVAAWMMMKRGCPVEYIHFYSYPYTGEQSKEKVLDLVRKLSCYQNKSFLHIVPFGEIQEALQRHCNERYRAFEEPLEFLQRGRCAKKIYFDNKKAFEPNLIPSLCFALPYRDKNKNEYTLPGTLASSSSRRPQENQSLLKEESKLSHSSPREAPLNPFLFQGTERFSLLEFLFQVQ